MAQSDTQSVTQLMAQDTLPSFSIIIETENLSTADLDGLIDCLNSLERQDIAPNQANEVILINSGDVPQELINQIHEQFPWTTPHRVDLELNYYDSKMHGVKLATGDVILFADSDCCYQNGWLRAMLTPFRDDSTVNIVGGETAMAIVNAYSLAMAMTYIFPPFSRKKDLYQANGYFCNNVAFRREFLLDHPIPSKLPIYRGNCSAHSVGLQELGQTIWRQPQARATHAPPENLFHFFWRFLLMGSDDLLMGKNSKEINPMGKISSTHLLTNRFKKALRRGRTILREKPARLAYLPLGLPIAFASLFLICVGFLVASLRPYWLLRSFEKLESQQHRAETKSSRPSMVAE